MQTSNKIHCHVYIDCPRPGTSNLFPSNLRSLYVDFPSNNPERSLFRQSFCMLFTHEPQRVCSSFKSPHASHRVIFFLSFIAFPTSCRFRFWECVVFFFGTARRIESHIPVMIGMSVVMEGMAKRKEGRSGATGCGVKGASRAR